MWTNSNYYTEYTLLSKDACGCMTKNVIFVLLSFHETTQDKWNTKVFPSIVVQRNPTTRE